MKGLYHHFKYKGIDLLIIAYITKSLRSNKAQALFGPSRLGVMNINT